MQDSIIIYRPYEDIPDSVECLSRHDLYFVGRLNLSLVIKNILGKLGLIDHRTDLIDNNHSVQYYWNNGNPYLNDLVYYYNVADELWMDQGGLGYDFLKEYEETILECEFIENESPWTDENGNVHKLLLLERDRQWYKRKFIDLKDRRLKDSSPFTKTGRPRSMKKRAIQTSTIRIDDV